MTTITLMELATGRLHNLSIGQFLGLGLRLGEPERLWSCYHLVAITRRPLP